MPLFRCSKCGGVENTATGWWWSHKHSSTPVQWQKPLCHAHGPKFVNGEFSDEEKGFHKYGEPLASATGKYVDQSGFIHGNLEGAVHCYGPIVGKYAEDGSIIPLTAEEQTEHERLNGTEAKAAKAEVAKKMFDSATQKFDRKAGRPWVSLSNKKSKQKKVKAKQT